VKGVQILDRRKRLFWIMSADFLFRHHSASRFSDLDDHQILVKAKLSFNRHAKPAYLANGHAQVRPLF
jgi:hypothetical protein